MAHPAIFVVKATIAPEQEAAFNEWYDTVRSGEIQMCARRDEGTSPVRGQPSTSAAGSTSERGVKR